MKKTYKIIPVPKPRMTRADRWKGRACVKKYWQFKDECRLLKIQIPDDGASITFILPMPTSWNKKKREQMNGKPHQSKPDIDNLIKALLDATMENDAGVWNIHACKLWGVEGSIIISATETR